MKSCNWLGTMTSVGLFLCVAGRANAYAAVFHSIMLSSVEVQAPLHYLVLLPFSTIGELCSHAVSQNRHCPTDYNLWLPPVQNESCLAFTEIVFNEGLPGCIAGLCGCCPFLLNTKNSYALYTAFTLVIALSDRKPEAFLCQYFFLGISVSNSVHIYPLPLILGTYINLPLFFN